MALACSEVTLDEKAAAVGLGKEGEIVKQSLTFGASVWF